MEVTQRHGTFSSSNIWKLCTTAKNGKDFGKPALTYIKQVQQEIRLKRPSQKEVVARPTSWGKLIERRVFNLLGLQYGLISRDRLVHSTIPSFSGMPDLIKGTDTTGDVKSPWDVATFCNKIDALEIGIEEYKNDFPEDYWQQISSTILLRDKGIPITNFEPIIYCPYDHELTEIREEASNYDGNQNDILFLNYCLNDELPWLNKDGYYKNLNIYNFPVPEDDVTFLTSRVIAAGALLIPR